MKTKKVETSVVVEVKRGCGKGGNDEGGATSTAAPAWSAGHAAGRVFHPGAASDAPADRAFAYAVATGAAAPCADADRFVPAAPTIPADWG